mgnify:CR=1 FL=1|tara:strand:- start:392 stop:1297 length:906 start_codon:yes stop_codon:yes gene_type:complete
MSTIITNTIPKSQRPGVNKFFGLYDKHRDFSKEMFDMGTSSLGYEEDVLISGSGLATVKGEANAVNFDSITQGFIQRYSHVVYGIGYSMSREAVEDGKYLNIMEKIVKFGTKSMETTKQTVAANIYNRAFDSNYTFGDGKELIATDHDSKGGTWQNEPTNSSDFSEASLEELAILIRKAKDDAGNEIALTPRKLIGAPDLEFDFQRVLKSSLQSGTANNDTNAVRDLGVIPQGFMCNPYLTNTDDWFIRTDAMDGMKGFQRRKREFTKDGDFTTENGLYKYTERYVFGATDPRGLYGNPGA